MITRLRLTNFRSIGRNVELVLGPFNVLVGVNGGGKSNILRALTFVRDAMRLGLSGAVTHANGIDAVRRHSKGHPHNVKVELELKLAAGVARYAFELTGDSAEEYRVKSEEASISSGSREMIAFEVRDGLFTGPENLRPNLDRQSLALTTLGGDTRLQPLWTALAQMMVYAINPSELRKPQKFSSEMAMLAEGENWVSILHTQLDAAWKKDLVVALGKLTGDVEDVRVTKAASFLVPEFRHQSVGHRKWFPAERESDGTLRVAGILTALLQQPSLPVIGIEEPEQTVHPGALPLIYDHLREASGRSQVIVTTHSPIFLNFIKLEECRVFVVGRGAEGTEVRTLTEAQKTSVEKDLLSLGDLILTGDLQLDLPWGNDA